MSAVPLDMNNPLEKFVFSCRFGNASVVKEYLQTQELEINEIFTFFRFACLSANSETVSCFLDKYPKLTVSFDNEFAFRYACQNGKMEFIHFLFEKNPNINISADNDFAFRMAAEFGRMEVLHFLYDMKKDFNIAFDNYGAYRNAYKKGHNDVIAFLLEKYPEINNHIHIVNGAVHSGENQQVLM
jgi:hypothetical protein